MLVEERIEQVHYEQPAGPQVGVDALEAGPLEVRREQALERAERHHDEGEPPVELEVCHVALDEPDAAGDGRLRLLQLGSRDVEHRA